ncbi:MAG TPA: hypothetical protein VJT78_10460 [Candidatus Dormibacteraeota bacterium]|nr:hypothetical protein [Candidatus Dormibacteraeota bacterium]
MVESKDVVLAMLGASAALAGFVLVFLGVVIASYQSYAGPVPDEVVRPYRMLGGILLGMFGLSLFALLCCLLWLVGGGPADGYGPVIAIFVVQVVAVFGVAAWASRLALWR